MRKFSHTLFASIALIVIVALTAGAVVVAHAAAGSVAQITLRVDSDGTAPFDADNSAGNDANANNGIIRSLDYVTYQWEFTVATSGDITFVHTLPVGMRWDPTSTADCSQGSTGISANKRTLTCTLPNQTAGSITNKNVKAQTLAGANGAELASTVTSGMVSSNEVKLTLSATPKLNLEHLAGAPSRGEMNGQPGIVVSYLQNISMPLDAAKGARGLESFAGSPITFTITPSANPTQAHLHSCSAGSPDGSRQPAVGTNQYSVVNAGTWQCDQPGGPGTPINVTITGMDTSLSYWPTKYVTNSSIAATLAYVAAGSVNLWYPSTSAPDGQVTNASSQTSGFDPLSASGVSNYGTGYSANQQPGAACVTSSFPANCAAVSVNLRDILFNSWVFHNNPNALTHNTGEGAVYSGQTVTFQGTITSGKFNPALTNHQHCYTFDNSLWNIASSGVPSDAQFEVEYGTHTYANDAARKAANCGLEGDGTAGWFANIADAGGAQNVTAVRIRVVNTVTYGQAITSPLPLTPVEGVASGTILPVFMQHSADQYAPRLSTYDPSTHASFSNGSRAIASEAQVKLTTAVSQPNTRPGNAHTLTVTPTVSNPFKPGQQVTAANTSVTVTMPSGCETYVPGSSLPAPSSIVAPLPGADGILCTADDTPQKLVYQLGNIASNQPISPITLSVNVNIAAPTPTARVYSAVIDSPSDSSRIGLRTATASNTETAVGQFSVSKQASVAKAVDGVPFTYTIGWVNSLANGVGLANVVDVLPFDGDSRGTTGLGSFELISASTTTQGVSLQYTTMNSLSLQAAVAQDPSGDTGITWTSTMPASGVTGVRLVVTSLPTVGTGFATLNVKASGLSPETLIVNTVNAKTAGSSTSVVDGSRTEVRSFASLVKGNVYFDNDYSFSKNTGDSPRPAVTVSYTGYKYGTNGVNDNGSGDDIAVTTPVSTTTNSQGEFAFSSIEAGKYTFTTSTPSGYSLGEKPAAQMFVAESTTVSNVNFGFFETVTAPVAVDDSATTAFETPIDIDVLANDQVDASAFISAVGVGSAGGFITRSADNKSLSYQPAAGFSGVETFTYTVIDKARQTDVALVSVTVVAKPVAANDMATMITGNSINVNVLANDTGSSLQVTSVTPNVNTHGTVSVQNGGTGVTYTPNATHRGIATFTYTVTDSVGQTATATVTVRVFSVLTAVNDSAQTGQNLSNQGVPVRIPVLTNDAGEQITITGFTQPSHGTVTGPDASLNLTYQPTDGYVGQDTFTYTITDPAGQTSTATVTLTVTEPPAVADDSVQTKQDTAVEIDVLANDSGSNLTVTSVQSVSTSGGSADGTVTILANGKVKFTPRADFTGAASFTYTISDALGLNRTATVQVFVVAAPTAQSFTKEVPEQGDAQEIDVRPYITFPTGSTVTVESITQPSKGEASIFDEAGDLDYLPTLGETGTTSFTYTIVDQLGQKATATITVNVIPAPIPRVIERTTRHAQPITIDPLALESSSTRPLQITSLSETKRDGTPSPTGARAVPNGQLIEVIPDPGFSDEYEFRYEVEDDLGQIALSTIIVRVLPPLFANDVQFTTPQDEKIRLNITLHPDAAVSSWATAAGGTIAEENGELWFTPNAGFTGSYSTTYTVTDSGGATETAQITGTVTPKAQPNGGGSSSNGSLTPSEMLAYTGTIGTAWVVVNTVLLLLAGLLLVALRAVKRRKETQH